MPRYSQNEADSVLRRALELTGAVRERFLDETCAPGTDLRRLVDRLLASCESDESVLRPGGGASGPLWEALAREYPGALQLDCGDRLGAWRVVRMLGRGGMATVYLCERADGQFEQRVALKVLDALRDFDELTVRFAQERQILATLNHPNIARLIDGGVAPAGQPYVVMEHVDGEPIDTYCDNRQLNVAARIELFERVAGAVQYAHGHLIVHRDIKPSNILVAADGQPKLLDFGIAKLLDPSTPHAAPQTRSALHPMTPEYASPEQVRGEVLTTSCDVYQLGYLLYQLLTGRAPYPMDRRNVAEVVRVICGIEPVRPSQVVRAMSGSTADQHAAAAKHSAARSTTPEQLQRRLAGDLDNILLTALHKEPQRRYSSVSHLRDDVRRHLEGMPVTARPPTLRYRAAKFLRRHLLGTAATAMVLMGLAIGSLALVLAYGQARRSEQQAIAAQSETAAINRFLRDILASPRPSASGARTLMVEVLEQAEARLPERFGEQPALASEVGAILAHSYDSLARHEQAARLRETLLREHAVAWQVGEPETLERAIELASNYAELSRFEDAQRLLAQVRERIAMHSPVSSRLVALADDADGLLAYRRGDVKAATRWLERAWRGAQRALTADDEAYRQIRMHLQRARLGQGDVRRAEAEVRALLADSIARFGERHAETLQARSMLLFVLHEQGRLVEAEEQARTNVQVAEGWLGEDDHYTITALSSLSTVLGALKNEDEASAVNARALRLARKTLGAEHPYTLTILGNQGVRLENAGRDAEADAVYAEAIALSSRTLGEEHRQTLLYRGNRAAHWRALGRHAQAAAELRKVVDGFERKAGSRSGDTLHFTRELAAALRALRQPDAAVEILAPALALAHETLGAESSLTRNLREELAEARLETAGRP